jgi:hypothetical protein
MDVHLILSRREQANSITGGRGPWISGASAWSERMGTQKSP